jgi:hypothetical protein
MSTVRVGPETKKRLIRVRGTLESKNGNARNFEDVINELIDSYEEKLLEEAKRKKE